MLVAIGGLAVGIRQCQLAENPVKNDLPIQTENAEETAELQTPNSKNQIKEEMSKPILGQSEKINEKLVPEKSSSNFKPIIPIEKEELEISIQLPDKSKGYNKVFLGENDAKLSSNSTLKNPRVMVESNSEIIQKIIIITKEGDTCKLERVFDKRKQKDFPVRFTPCN